MKKKSRYEKIILDIFEQNYNGQEEFEFERSEIIESCKRLGIDPPKNLGDVIYTFRYRRSLPPVYSGHSASRSELVDFGRWRCELSVSSW